MKRTKSTRSRRTLFRSCRFTPEELACLKEKAQLCGMTTSRFIREVELGRRPWAKPDALTNELIYHLCRIGNNLKQLHRLAKAQGDVELSRMLEQAAHSGEADPRFRAKAATRRSAATAEAHGEWKWPPWTIRSEAAGC